MGAPDSQRWRKPRDNDYKCERPRDSQCIDFATGKHGAIVERSHNKRDMSRKPKEIPWFSQLWSCKEDTGFRPFAFAAFSFARVVDLSSNRRAALYREIATAKRAELLDRLSGLIGWKSRIRLLPKTTYRSFDEMDWRALFVASEDPATRRALGHMHEISPLLVHQLPLVPEPIRLPNFLTVLNGLRVSAAHWQQLSDALAETPPQLLPSLVAKAERRQFNRLVLGLLLRMHEPALAAL